MSVRVCVYIDNQRAQWDMCVVEVPPGADSTHTLVKYVLVPMYCAAHPFSINEATATTTIVSAIALIACCPPAFDRYTRTHTHN